MHDRWLLSYADFVTLLLAVFIVLFASAWSNGRSLRTISTAIHLGFDALSVNSPQQQRGNAVGTVPQGEYLHAPSTPAPPKVSSSELGQQLQSVLGDAMSKNEIVMQQTPEGLIISLRELGFFNSGEATLLPGAADKLRGTARVLMQHGLGVRVEGHSDNQPIHTATFDSNWELSAARAISVLSLLLNEMGFPPDKLSVAGYGPYHPVADNATAEGRRMNRRVDLVVIAPGRQEANLH